MNYLYKGSISRNGSLEQSRESDPVESMEQARQWIRQQGKVRSATILRADTEGINAGKFFLHLIVK